MNEERERDPNVPLRKRTPQFEKVETARSCSALRLTDNKREEKFRRGAKLRETPNDFFLEF